MVDTSTEMDHKPSLSAWALSAKMKFYVFQSRKRYGDMPYPHGYFQERKTLKFDAVGSAFAYVHLRASHGPDNVAIKWKRAEQRLLDRYSTWFPGSWKKERL